MPVGRRRSSWSDRFRLRVGLDIRGHIRLDIRSRIGRRFRLRVGFNVRYDVRGQVDGSLRSGVRVRFRVRLNARVARIACDGVLDCANVSGRNRIRSFVAGLDTPCEQGEGQKASNQCPRRARGR